MSPGLIALALAGAPVAGGGPAAPAIDTRTTPPPAPDEAVPASRASRHAKGDPLEGFNRRMFRANRRFDRRFFRPVALGYAHAVPRPVRSGLRHFFSNLGEPIVFLNYLLQLKPGKAMETFGRFVVNSTFGVAGVMDVAKGHHVDLPHRANGFGDTLGYYGVKPGAYLFLPFVGPTTVRDLIGGQGDALVLPLAVGTPFDKLYYQIPKGVVTGLDQRAESDADLKALFAGAVDPYATLRSVYLQDRAGEIAHLKGARRSAAAQTPLADPLDDPAAAAGPGELNDPLADPAAATATRPQSPAPELQDPLSDPAKAH